MLVSVWSSVWVLSSLGPLEENRSGSRAGTTLQGRAVSWGYMEKMVLPGAGKYVRMRAPVTNGL